MRFLPQSEAAGGKSRAGTGLRLAAVSGLGAMAAACVTVAAPAPNLDVPARYRQAATRPDAAPPSPDWWRGFRSAELTRLVEASRTGNLDIAAAVARIRQADAQAEINGAALLPTLDGAADVSRARGARLASSGPRRGRASYGLSLSASYEIDFWGKNRALLDAALASARASRFDRDTVEITALASTATTYFDMLATQDRLRIARGNVVNAGRVLDVIRQRLAAGTATALDVAQQQSLVAQQKASIPPLEQEIVQDQATLAVLVGHAPARVSIPGGSLDRLASPRITPGLPSELLTRRPDIRSAEESLAAAHADVVAARAQFFPSIQLTGQGGIESLALKSLLQPSSTFYSIAAGLTQPIFDGGTLQGQFDQAKGAEAEALANYRKAVVSAFADVEKALVAIRQLTRQEALQRDVVTSASLAYRLSEQQLREGTIDITTVLNNQTTLFQAENTLVEVRLSRFQAIVALVQALGGGWDKPDAAPGRS